MAFVSSHQGFRAQHTGGHQRATGHARQAHSEGVGDPRDTFVSGEHAVKIASNFLGYSAQSVKGHLDHYQAAGGAGNDCADFVSSVEMNASRMKHHQINVGDLKRDLLHEGWRAVNKRQTHPGDVAIYGDYHTEIVANRGASRLIGANGSDGERVSYTGSWGNPTYYTPPTHNIVG